jgi:hypothetical protein
VQNQVYEVDDEDEEDDIQEVEAKTIPKGNNGKTHVEEDEDDDDEIQEVNPPPQKAIKSRGGSRKPSSTVNGQTTVNGTTIAATKTKGKAKEKPKIGPPKSVLKPIREPMDVDPNDIVEHEMDVDVNGAALIANTINAAIKNNAGRTSKIHSGQQNDDRTIARLEEALRQVRFRLIGNYRPLFVLFLLSSQS